MDQVDALLREQAKTDVSNMQVEVDQVLQEEGPDGLMILKALYGNLRCREDCCGPDGLPPAVVTEEMLEGWDVRWQVVSAWLESHVISFGHMTRELSRHIPAVLTIPVALNPAGSANQARRPPTPRQQARIEVLQLAPSPEPSP